jgi:hypothetical protein
MTHARRPQSSHENTRDVWVKVTVTKPVWFRVRRLRACTPKCVSARRRELLKTKDLTE